MYKEILRSMVGIEVFPLLSLCLFVLVFAVVLVRTSRLDAARLARLAQLPLDGQPHESSSPNRQGVPL